MSQSTEAQGGLSAVRLTDRLFATTDRGGETIYALTPHGSHEFVIGDVQRVDGKLTLRLQPIEVQTSAPPAGLPTPPPGVAETAARESARTAHLRDACTRTGESGFTAAEREFLRSGVEAAGGVWVEVSVPTVATRVVLTEPGDEDHLAEVEEGRHEPAQPYVSPLDEPPCRAEQFDRALQEAFRRVGTGAGKSVEWGEAAPHTLEIEARLRAEQEAIIAKIREEQHRRIEAERKGTFRQEFVLGVDYADPPSLFERGAPPPRLRDRLAVSGNAELGRHVRAQIAALQPSVVGGPTEEEDNGFRTALLDKFVAGALSDDAAVTLQEHHFPPVNVDQQRNIVAPVTEAHRDKDGIYAGSGFVSAPARDGAGLRSGDLDPTFALCLLALLARGR